MVVVPTHAAEVNCIVGNSCLILPQAKLFCDYGVLFWVFFFSLPSSSLCPCGWYPCKLPTVPNGVPLPLGVHSGAEGVFAVLCFSGIADKVLTVWEAPAVAPGLTAHLVPCRSLWTGSR